MGNLTPPALTAPAPISAQHDVSQFDCGKAALNDWLRQRAQKNEGRASRCFVVCDGHSVVGFYALAAGSVRITEVPKPLRKNMPPEIPVLVLGRIAVDVRHQGRKIGQFLLRDALQRSLAVAQNIGARALLVHAIDQDVVPFYMQFKFRPFPDGDLTLFLSLSDVAAALDPKS
jgi:predicted N-acetyltransferase YhbS